jgi:DNA-binding CsgD family transcriptional regulator
MGHAEGVRKQEFGGPVPTVSRFSPLLVRPYALAGSRWEPLVAGLSITLLVLVFIAEILTPDFVVGAFAVLPMLVAVWVLSRWFAASLTVLAMLLITAAALIEQSNRVTIILLGVTLLMTTGLARVYATSLAFLLANRRHLRPTSPTQAMPITLDGVERASHGLRSLTRRELDVARLAAEGYTAAEISDRLHIGVRTVESHLASTYSKLQISSRPQLIRMASKLSVTLR